MRTRTPRWITWLHRARSATLRVLAAVAVVAVACLGAVAVPPAAAAATLGAGLSYGGNPSNGYVGNYVVGGVYAYCIDPGMTWPLAASSDAGLVSAYTSSGPAAGENAVALSSTTLGKINYLVTTWGQTSDPLQAAAVAMAVATTANPAAYAAHTSPWGDQYYSSYTSAGNWNTVKSLVAAYRAAAAAYSPSSGTGTAGMSFTVDNNNYTGHLNITALSPSPASGTITLTNGVFTNGTPSLSGVFAVGQSIPVNGVPPAGATDYEISAVASFTAPGGPAGNVHLWTTPGRQSVASPGSTSPSSFSATAHDPFDRTTTFAPVVTTQVPSVAVKMGDVPQDEITFSTTNFTDVASGQTVNNPWPQTGGGAYFPLTARGTWYGPSSAPLSQSATIPANMPVAGHTTVIMSTVAGPTTTYTATSDTPALEAGYYTWVWSINFTDQTAGTQFYLPDNYSFADEFGRASEGQFSPSQLTFGTQLDNPVATRCNSITDTITPTLSGGAWLLDSGDVRVPVTLTGEVYWEQARPTQSPTAPGSATHIGTVSAVLGSPAPITSPAFSVGCETGFMTVQWSIKEADQPAQYRGLFSEWSDDYGIPAETVQVLGPSITTQALITGPGGIAQDVATVTGPIPAAGMDIVWNGYLRPAFSNVAVCTPATLAFTSADPTLVEVAGEYTSEVFSTPADFVGSIDWVETVTLHGGTEILHTGVCGAAGETSVSALPTVSTAPPVTVKAGTSAIDTLTVDGWVPPSATAVVRLFKATKGATALVCDNTTQVGGDLGPIALTPGIANAATYKSPASPALKAGSYGFVVQLLDQSGTVMAEGGCHDELFTVQTLAFTGAGAATRSWLGGATWLLLVGVAMLLIERRRKHFAWSNSDSITK
jgi:hypothetical protein